MRHAVILAGGGGTRLWPASRRSRPKQFLSLTGESKSLLTLTAERLSPSCGDRIWVVTTAEQGALVQESLPSIAPEAIIAEPAARNTASALGLAALHLLHKDPDAVMAAIPADQYIGDSVKFLETVDQAFRAAEEHEAIITLGIVPTRPETGYGYLKIGEKVSGELRRVEAFVEKPDAAKAQEYIASSNYLWNAGMFFCRAQILLNEIHRHLPETARGLDVIGAALSRPESDQVCEGIYPTLPNISIDYGVMERTTRAMTIAGDFSWNDVGSWEALAEIGVADQEGNIKSGQVVTFEANDNIIVGDPQGVIALAGVNNLVVVRSGDAILVLPRDRCQDVRALVQALRDGNLEQFL